MEGSWVRKKATRRNATLLSLTRPVTCTAGIEGRGAVVVGNKYSHALNKATNGAGDVGDDKRARGGGWEVCMRDNDIARGGSTSSWSFGVRGVEQRHCRLDAHRRATDCVFRSLLRVVRVVWASRHPLSFTASRALLPNLCSTPSLRLKTDASNTLCSPLNHPTSLAIIPPRAHTLPLALQTTLVSVYGCKQKSAQKFAGFYTLNYPCSGSRSWFRCGLAFLASTEVGVAVNWADMFRLGMLLVMSSASLSSYTRT